MKSEAFTRFQDSVRRSCVKKQRASKANVHTVTKHGVRETVANFKYIYINSRDLEILLRRTITSFTSDGDISHKRAVDIFEL